MRAERATASEVDVAWPERIAIGRLALARPWLLLERDDTGALALRALAPPPGGEKTGGATGDELALTVARLTIEDGGLRVVDRAISPAFAVDLDAGTLRMEGLSTVARPLRSSISPRASAAPRSSRCGARSGPSAAR